MQELSANKSFRETLARERSAGNGNTSGTDVEEALEQHQENEQEAATEAADRLRALMEAEACAQDEINKASENAAASAASLSEVDMLAALSAIHTPINSAAP